MSLFRTFGRIVQQDRSDSVPTVELRILQWFRTPPPALSVRQRADGGIANSPVRFARVPQPCLSDSSPTVELRILQCVLRGFSSLVCQIAPNGGFANSPVLFREVRQRGPRPDSDIDDIYDGYGTLLVLKPC